MGKRIVALMASVAGILTYGFVLPGAVAAQTLSGQISARLLQRLETAEISQTLTVAGESMYASMLLPHFYAQRYYRSAWSDNDGLLPQVETFIQALRDAHDEGLDPRDYHLAAIEVFFEEMHQYQERQTALDPDRLADLELLLSDAFLTYAAHLLVGSMNPHVRGVGQVADHTGVDLISVLHDALASGRVREVLRGLPPSHAGYTRLRQTLARYRGIVTDGGWPVIKPGPSLHEGDRDERVVALRTRLWITGDLEAVPEISEARMFDEADRFDGALERAVRAFQQRHGLEVDGVVGDATRAALNVPVEVRVRQIALNMERWRWLSRELGPRYIQVNIPAFRLDVMENDQSVLNMRVVVGKPYQRTPVFSETMTYLVLNPYWQVPGSIARREILPRLRKEPEYLATHNMNLFQGWGAGAQAIDPQTIDWSTMTAKDFRYRLRQEPGSKNALGRVKFIFPNRHNVYLHDTPSRSLFAKTVRAFSHGCIRLENPIALAAYVLQGEPRWTRQAILDTIARGGRRRVHLPEAIPVHLVYRTAWVDSGGTVQFRPDIYQLDRPQETSFCGATPCG